MKTYFKDNLKFLRKKYQLSQNDVAKIVNKERSLIGHWENGSRSVTLEDIIKLSGYFNITIDQLIGVDLSNEIIMKENELEHHLKQYALNYGVKLVIDKTSPLCAETALKIQNEIQQILLEEIKISQK